MARRLPDPPYTPPTKMEEELGYWQLCDGCSRRWSKRYVDERTHRCLPCSREWRRDDMMSRRSGFGGVPLRGDLKEHVFASKVLQRDVNLNSDDGKDALASNEAFRDEVASYIRKLIATNARPRPPLRGVLPLLSSSKPKRQSPVMRPTDVAEGHRTSVSREGEASVDAIMKNAMETIDAEIVDEG